MTLYVMQGKHIHLVPYHSEIHTEIRKSQFPAKVRITSSELMKTWAS